MALLIFPPDSLTPPLAALLDPNLRKDIAKRVNEAILTSQGERTRTKLIELVKTRAWAEKIAREDKKVDLPSKIDIWQASGEGGQESRSESREVSREDSVMHGVGEAEGAAS